MFNIIMLQIKDIYKSYKQNCVLKGVSFEVKDDEIKAIIGVNGAGKSTLIEIITNVKKADSGEVVINGININDKNSKNKVKNIFGYMPQSFCMFNDLTVRENLGYVAAVYGLEKTQIEKTIKMCGLESMQKTLAKNLSGGYKQLLSMAIAIIHSPKLLLLDEPTSAMDPIFRRKFWDIVHKYKKNGSMVLIITHYLEELLECDSFVCLSDGKVCFDGSVSTFKEKGFINIEKVLENCINNKVKS